MPENLTPQKLVSIIIDSASASNNVVPTKLDQRLVADLGIDSLGVIELVMEAEKRLDEITKKPGKIDITIEKAREMTLRDVVQATAELYLGNYNPRDYNDPMLNAA